MSRVMSLSVMFASYNMINWCVHLGLWNCKWLYDESCFIL